MGAGIFPPNRVSCLELMVSMVHLAMERMVLRAVRLTPYMGSMAMRKSRSLMASMLIHGYDVIQILIHGIDFP